MKYQQEKNEQKKNELEAQKKKEIETTMKVQQLLKMSESERKARVSGDKPTKGRSPSSMKINQVFISINQIPLHFIFDGVIIWVDFFLKQQVWLEIFFKLIN